MALRPPSYGPGCAARGGCTTAVCRVGLSESESAMTLPVPRKQCAAVIAAELLLLAAAGVSSRALGFNCVTGSGCTTGNASVTVAHSASLAFEPQAELQCQWH